MRLAVSGEQREGGQTLVQTTSDYRRCLAGQGSITPLLLVSRSEDLLKYFVSDLKSQEEETQFLKVFSWTMMCTAGLDTKYEKSRVCRELLTRLSLNPG